MKFEENWPRGFRREVVQGVDGPKEDGWTDDDRRQVITTAHPEPGKVSLKRHLKITQGAMADNPRGQNLDLQLKGFTTLIIIVSFSHESLIHFEKMTFQHFPHTNAWGSK